jgi:hypothetical protein
VDDLHLGVRCTSAAVQDIVDQALAAHLVRGVDAPPNYSVQIEGPQGRAPVAGLHFAYEGAAVVARSRDPRRVLLALVNHLAARRLDTPADLLRVSATVLVGDGWAVLAPVAVRGARDVLERRLLACGMRIVDAPAALVDTERVEVVVREPALEVDWSALDVLEGLVPRSGPADVPPPAGRYRLLGWGMLIEGREPGPIDAALAVASAAQALSDLPDAGAGDALRRLASLTDHVRFAAVEWGAPADITAGLAALR